MALFLTLVKIIVIKGHVDFICALEEDEHVGFLKFETGTYFAKCYIELIT